MATVQLCLTKRVQLDCLADYNFATGLPQVVWNGPEMATTTRWAPTKVIYNPSYAFIRSFRGILTPFITCSGRPCINHQPVKRAGIPIFFCVARMSIRIVMSWRKTPISIEHSPKNDSADILFLSCCYVVVRISALIHYTLGQTLIPESLIPWMPPLSSVGLRHIHAGSRRYWWYVFFYVEHLGMETAWNMFEDTWFFDLSGLLL